MSATNERSAGTGGTGKSTHRTLSVGEATRALTVPQAPYADAVHAALTDAGLAPDVVETGVRRTGTTGRWELHIRLVWLPGHPALAAGMTRGRGLVLAWAPMTGWSVHDLVDEALLPVSELADPPLLVDAVRHYARHGLGGPVWEPGADGRWPDAVHLDIALADWDEREQGLGVDR